MTFPILPSNSPSGIYSIDNSLRFNDNDTPRLDKTFSTSNRKTWTWSCWIKRSTVSNANQRLISYFISPNQTFIRLDSSDRFEFFVGGYKILSSAKLRDVSAWYHLQISIDTTQATSSNRAKMYINGVQITDFDTETYPPQNTDTFFNYGATQICGDDSASPNEVFDGYMAEMHFIDGQQLSPTDFGEFDEDSGIWKPKAYEGTYSGNSFYLDFENSGSLGADASGLGNNFTPTNLASTDQTTDTPTNNFCTLNSVEKIDTTPSEGNCQFNGNAVSLDSMRGTIGMPTGKWYWEVKVIAIGVGGNIGIATNDSALSAGGTLTGVLQQYSGFKSIDGWSNNGSYGGFTTGDIIGVALDMDAGEIEFYKNGTSQGVAYSSLDTTKTFFPFVQGSTSLQYGVNFGNPSFSISSGNSDGNGYGNFEYAPPSGYLALCTQNLATVLSPTIDDGSQYQNQVIYTGDGTSPRSITGLGFQPDLLWFKSRNSADAHFLYDTNRGVYLAIRSNASNAESSNTEGVQSFDSDGWTMGNFPQGNFNGNNYVTWGWKCTGSTSSNTDGSITSTVQANTTAGFSIVTFTGTGANGTFGHGLGAVPKFIIFKNRTDASNWICYHEALGNTTGVYLNLTNANAGTSSAFFNNTTPTSSVVSVGVMNEGNGSGDNIVAYCFAPITGYSAMGKYTGNGSTDGTFVYTGFRPAWVVSKRTDSTSDWLMRDTTRDTFNVTNLFLKANASNAEASSGDIDILSNGFKWRSSTAGQNGSGASYIYLAFSENPFVSSSGVPVVAR